MPHNPHIALQPDFHLPGHAVVALKGPDAITFAQAQFMNDVGALTDGQWQWNGWLTPKGRVIALFALLRIDAQTLWMLLPDVAAHEFVPLLQRYVFRSKVTLSTLETPIAGAFRAATIAAGASFAVLDDGRVELDMHGEDGPRRLLIGVSPARDDVDAVARWAQADLVHGLPRLPASQREQWTPQQLSLERLRAFSVKKGCYPGQEIVARTHYLGQAKRGLALFETPIDATSEVVAGSAVDSAGRSIGSVACVNRHLLLAVMPLDASTEGLSSNSITMQPRKLLTGLAR